ncbi:hypothetical protein ACWDVW_05980, partial [Micromonospora sp. NPDC003241]
MASDTHPDPDKLDALAAQWEAKAEDLDRLALRPSEALNRVGNWQGSGRAAATRVLPNLEKNVRNTAELCRRWARRLRKLADEIRKKLEEIRKQSLVTILSVIFGIIFGLLVGVLIGPALAALVAAMARAVAGLATALRAIINLSFQFGLGAAVFGSTQLAAEVFAQAIASHVDGKFEITNESWISVGAAAGLGGLFGLSTRGLGKVGGGGPKSTDVPTVKGLDGTAPGGRPGDTPTPDVRTGRGDVPGVGSPDGPPLGAPPPYGAFGGRPPTPGPVSASSTPPPVRPVGGRAAAGGAAPTRTTRPTTVDQPPPSALGGAPARTTPPPARLDGPVNTPPPPQPQPRAGVPHADTRPPAVGNGNAVSSLPPPARNTPPSPAEAGAPPVGTRTPGGPASAGGEAPAPPPRAVVADPRPSSPLAPEPMPGGRPPAASPDLPATPVGGRPPAASPDVPATPGGARDVPGNGPARDVSPNAPTPIRSGTPPPGQGVTVDPPVVRPGGVGSVADVPLPGGRPAGSTPEPTVSAPPPTRPVQPGVEGNPVNTPGGGSVGGPPRPGRPGEGLPVHQVVDVPTPTPRPATPEPSTPVPPAGQPGARGPLAPNDLPADVRTPVATRPPLDRAPVSGEPPAVRPDTPVTSPRPTSPAATRPTTPEQIPGDVTPPGSRPGGANGDQPPVVGQGKSATDTTPVGASSKGAPEPGKTNPVQANLDARIRDLITEGGGGTKGQPGVSQSSRPGTLTEMRALRERILADSPGGQPTGGNALVVQRLDDHIADLTPRRPVGGDAQGGAGRQFSGQPGVETPLKQVAVPTKPMPGGPRHTGPDGIDARAPYPDQTPVPVVGPKGPRLATEPKAPGLPPPDAPPGPPVRERFAGEWDWRVRSDRFGTEFTLVQRGPEPPQGTRLGGASGEPHGPAGSGRSPRTHSVDPSDLGAGPQRLGDGKVIRDDQFSASSRPTGGLRVEKFPAEFRVETNGDKFVRLPEQAMPAKPGKGQPERPYFVRLPDPVDRPYADAGGRDPEGTYSWQERNPGKSGSGLDRGRGQTGGAQSRTEWQLTLPEGKPVGTTSRPGEFPGTGHRLDAGLSERLSDAVGNMGGMFRRGGDGADPHLLPSVAKTSGPGGARPEMTPPAGRDAVDSRPPGGSSSPESWKSYGKGHQFSDQPVRPTPGSGLPSPGPRALDGGGTVPARTGDITAPPRSTVDTPAPRTDSGSFMRPGRSAGMESGGSSRTGPSQGSMAMREPRAGSRTETVTPDRYFEPVVYRPDWVTNAPRGAADPPRAVDGVGGEAPTSAGPRAQRASAGTEGAPQGGAKRGPDGPSAVDTRTPAGSQPGEVSGSRSGPAATAGIRPAGQPVPARDSLHGQMTDLVEGAAKRAEVKPGGVPKPSEDVNLGTGTRAGESSRTPGGGTDSAPKPSGQLRPGEAFGQRPESGTRRLESSPEPEPVKPGKLQKDRPVGDAARPGEAFGQRPESGTRRLESSPEPQAGLGNLRKDRPVGDAARPGEAFGQRPESGTRRLESSPEPEPVKPGKLRRDAPVGDSAPRPGETFGQRPESGTKRLEPSTVPGTVRKDPPAGSSAPRTGTNEPSTPVRDGRPAPTEQPATTTPARASQADATPAGTVTPEPSPKPEPGTTPQPATKQGLATGSGKTPSPESAAGRRARALAGASPAELEVLQGRGAGAGLRPDQRV